MPAGDLVVADWQLELRSTLMGATTDYHIAGDADAIGGLYDVEVKQSETDYAHADGSFVGEAYLASRTLTVALVVLGSDLADVGTNLEALQAVWAPSSTDLPLYLRLPGLGKRYVNGRPLGLVVRFDPHSTAIPVLASFRITDPTIHT